MSGNYIGLNANGAGILPNKSEGVVLSSLAHGNLIGGDTAGERNIISGNGGDGVAILVGQYRVGQLYRNRCYGYGLPREWDGLGGRHDLGWT